MKTIIDFANKVNSLVDVRMTNIANVETSPSTHAYAVGKQLIFNGLLCKATSAIAVGDTLAVGTNLALSDNVVEQIYSLNQGLTNSLNEIADMNNVLGAKNLLPNNSASWTSAGITFTVNSDGSVTANGTASETVWSRVSDNIKLDNIAYTLNGCPEGGGGEIYDIHIRSTESDSSQWQFFRDFGNGITFTGDPNRNYVCYITVAIGKTVSNLTFYPMLRPASIQDDTYVPYTMTNRKLSKKIQHVRIDFKQNIIDQLGNTSYYESADGLIQKSVYVFLPAAYTSSNVECVCTQVQTSSCFGMTSAAVFNSSGRVYVWFNALLQNITAKALAEGSSKECYIDFLILMK